MNMNQSQPAQDPNAYNPPNIFAGLNMSMGAAPKAPKSSQNMNTGPTPAPSQSFPMQLNLGEGMNTQKPQMSFSPGMNQVQNNPAPSSSSMFMGMQLSNQPSTSSQPGSSMPSLQPQLGAFQNQEHNISTEFVNVGKEGDMFSMEGMKLDQTGTTDNSLPEEEAPKETVTKPETSGEYNPPDLFANLNLSSYNQKPAGEKSPKPAVNEQKPVTSPTPGHWNTYKKNVDRTELTKTVQPTKKPDFVSKESTPKFNEEKVIFDRF